MVWDRVICNPLLEYNVIACYLTGLLKGGRLAFR